MADNCEIENCPFDQKEWGKLVQKIDDMAKDVVEIKVGVLAQNGRVRKLEQWRAYIIGIGAAISFLAYAILKGIWK